MQNLLCTPASRFGIEMPSLEIVIVCVIPLIMMLQKWASKPSLVVPSARQRENEQAHPPADGSHSTTRQETVPSENVTNSSQGIFQAVVDSPLEIRSLIAEQLSNSDVASVSTVCRDSNEAFWNSEGVWLALGTQAGLPLVRSGVAKFTRESYRRAAYRVDCDYLALLASGPQANTDTNLFNEASHVVQGLMPGDTQEIQVLLKLMVSMLESLNFVAAGSAEAFLRKAHNRADIFSRQDLEMLDGAYDYALLQHNVMMETIEEHFDDFETQMQSFEQQVCEDHRSLIMDQ